MGSQLPRLEVALRPPPLVPSAEGSSAGEPARQSQEPGECAAYRYVDPGTIAPALAALAEALLPEEEKRRRARVVLRGCLHGPGALQRRFAAELAEAFERREERLDVLLREAAMEAMDSQLWSEELGLELVAETPAPLDGLLALYSGGPGPGAEALRRVKPLDVLAVPELRPSDLPRSAHAFLQVLQSRQGPLHRSKDYIRVQREERDHFPFVIEQVRAVAPEFFRQYCAAEVKDGAQLHQLVTEADAFLTHVTERLFSLALIEQLPEVGRRQTLLDSAGSAAHRWRFAREFRWVPPPLSAVAVAFGIDARARVRSVGIERPMLAWQRAYLWPRRRTFQLVESLFPSLQVLGDMALSVPLRHRPFASFLAELHEHEDSLLRPWYSKMRPEEPVLHLLWSAELVRELGAYLTQALRAAAEQYGAGGAPPTVLCLGSGAARLRRYLHFILDRALPGRGIRVAAAVPATHGRARRTAGEPLPPVAWEEPDALEGPPAPAEGRLTLAECLEVYRPCVVVCACMPPEVDWTRSLRACPGVVEYLLVGPADSGRSGSSAWTWGCASPFRRRGQAPPVPSYAREGFLRKDLPELSALCLGTEDAPGRVGANAAVAFRRLLRSGSASSGTGALAIAPPASAPFLEGPTARALPREQGGGRALSR